MSALGSLVVKLALDYAQYTSGLSKSEQDSLAFAKRVQDQVDQLKVRVGTAVGSVAGLIAAGLSINAFKGLLDGAVSGAAALEDLAASAGTTVEALSGLASVGKFSDMGAEEIAASMNKLTKNLTSVTEESAGSGKAIRALGLDVDSFRALKPEEQMMSVAKALGTFEDGAGKSAVAMALFGKEGAKMLPFFKDLADVGELQAKVTTEQAAAAANYEDNLTRITASSDAWTKELVMGMIPALDTAAQAYLDVMNGTGGLRDEVRQLSRDGSIAEWTRNAIKGLTYVMDVASGLKAVVKSLGSYWGALAATAVETVTALGEAASKALKGDFSGAADELSGVAGRVSTIWSSLGDDLGDIWGEQTLGSKLRARIDELATAGKTAAEAKKHLDVTGLGVADKATKDKVDPTIKAYADLTASIREKINAQGLELDMGSKLTESQKVALDVQKLVEKGSISAAQASSAEMAALLGLLSVMDAETAAEARRVKQLDDLAAARGREITAASSETASLQQQLKAQNEANEALGLSTTALAALEAARLSDAAAAKERMAAIIQEEEGNTTLADQYLEQARLLRDLAAARQGGARARDELDMWNSIESTAKGVWTSVTEQGQNAWKRIGQTLKSAVLDLLWQITGRQWLISIGAAAGVPGAAMAASTGASALSTAGTAASVINAGSTIGTMLGVAGQGISSFTTAVTAGVQSMVGITGTTAQMTASLQAAGYWTGSATSTAVTTAGAQAGSSVMAAAPYAAAAVAALYALGAFRTTKTVGSGLMGTLGEADGITSYDLRRKSGTLFTGPDYSIRDNGVAAQNAALQGAFSAMKAGALQVADAFGLSADTVADFTYRIGNELINPDTGGYGLKLEGLTEAQVQEKISAALAQANDAIAAQILTVAGAMRTDLLPWMQRIADASGPTAATLQAIAEYPNKLLEVAGTSRDALVQTFAQGLMTGDAQTAGQSVANQLVASIEASLMGNASAQIFDIINRGIVTPMIDALITGQSVTDALSQASIDAVVAKATAAAKTMGALFGSAEFQAAMDAIRSSVGSALGTAGAGLAYTPQYQLPATTVATAADSANDLGATVDDLAKKFASARDSLTETAQSLQVDLLRALGDESGARAAERAAYLAGFTDLGQAEQDRLGVLYDQNQAIRDQIKEIQKTKDAVEAARTGLVAYRAALVGTIDLAAGEVDGVLTALEKSAAKDRKALETSRTASQSLVQDVTRVFDRLQSAVDSLFDSTASTQQWQAAQGQQYIRDALTAARLTGAMPDAEDLARAIAAATSGLDATQYGTQAEADYARLVLANELRDLQDISGDQLSEAQRMLTVAEDQLTALDDSLQAYRDQIDVMRGVQQYTGTTAELMARLVAAMEAERGLRASTAAKALIGTGQAIYDLKTGNGVNAAGAAFNGAELAQAARDALAAGATGQSIYYAIQGSGFSLAQAETILGATPGSLAKEAAAMGLPSFDVGINRVPRDMTARIHADEAVLPAPFNPWAGGTLPGFGGADQTALIAEVRALRTQNEQLEARLASMETNTRRTADSLERVTQNNALTVSAAPVF